MMSYPTKQLVEIGIKKGQFPVHVYKFFDPSDPNFRDSITKGYLWFSDPSGFNDPFDFHIDLDFQATLPEYEQYLRRASNNTMEEEHVKVLAKQYFDNPSQREEKLNLEARKVLQKHGVACFSKIPDSILMWSHYTKKHSGVCIKYDLLEIVTDDMFPLPVKYTDDHPNFNYVKDWAKGRELATALALTKASVWEYEKEIRIISTAHGEHAIPKAAVLEVIFGCRCTTQNDLVQLFNNSGYNPKYFQAKRANKKFIIEFQPH